MKLNNNRSHVGNITFYSKDGTEKLHVDGVEIFHTAATTRTISTKLVHSTIICAIMWRKNSAYIFRQNREWNTNKIGILLSYIIEHRPI